MLDFLFFAGLVLYFVSVAAHFLGLAFRNEKVTKTAWLVFYGGFALNLGYMVARGITAGRLPLAVWPARAARGRRVPAPWGLARRAWPDRGAARG